jgi:hypothetical protein
MLLHHFYFQVNLCSRVETWKHGIVKGTVSTEIECYFGTYNIKYLFHQEPLMVKNKVFVRDSREKIRFKIAIMEYILIMQIFLQAHGIFKKEILTATSNI